MTPATTGDRIRETLAALPDDPATRLAAMRLLAGYRRAALEAARLLASSRTRAAIEARVGGLRRALLADLAALLPAAEGGDR